MNYCLAAALASALTAIGLVLRIASLRHRGVIIIGLRYSPTITRNSNHQEPLPLEPEELS